MPRGLFLFNLLLNFALWLGRTLFRFQFPSSAVFLFPPQVTIPNLPNRVFSTHPRAFSTPEEAKIAAADIALQLLSFNMATASDGELFLPSPCPLARCPKPTVLAPVCHLAGYLSMPSTPTHASLQSPGPANGSPLMSVSPAFGSTPGQSMNNPYITSNPASLSHQGVSFSFSAFFLKFLLVSFRLFYRCDLSDKVPTNPSSLLSPHFSNSADRCHGHGTASDPDHDRSSGLLNPHGLRPEHRGCPAQHEPCQLLYESGSRRRRLSWQRSCALLSLLRRIQRREPALLVISSSAAFPPSSSALIYPAIENVSASDAWLICSGYFSSIFAPSHRPSIQ